MPRESAARNCSFMPCHFLAEQWFILTCPSMSYALHVVLSYALHVVLCCPVQQFLLCCACTSCSSLLIFLQMPTWQVQQDATSLCLPLLPSASIWIIIIVDFMIDMPWTLHPGTVNHLTGDTTYGNYTVLSNMGSGTAKTPTHC